MKAESLKSVSRAQFHVKPLLLCRFPDRLEPHGIWLELVCSLIRIVKDLIIELKVKTQDRIRHSHLKHRLMHLHELALIRLVYLNGRIKVLR